MKQAAIQCDPMINRTAGGRSNQLRERHDSSDFEAETETQDRLDNKI